MQAKLNEQQFKGVVMASLPTYYLKLNQTCLEKCQVNLTDTTAGPDLTEEETACINTCARAYVRMTKQFIGHYEKKLT